MSLTPSTFIIRISPETRDGKLVAWHGSVEKVGEQQRLYFTSLDSISRYIQESAGFTIQPAPLSSHDLWDRIRDAFRNFWRKPEQ